MSAADPGRGAAAAHRVGAASTRLRLVWGRLPGERRLAATASLALFLTLFLPWYQETVVVGGGVPHPVTASVTGWSAFSFVEAALLIIAAGVLTLLFMRAEGRPFHVPGGDGGVITAAGGWACLLIVWRIFDKTGSAGRNQYAPIYGIEWGIILALGVAGLLTYAGTRIRRAHDPEPALPGDGYLGPRAGEPTASGRRPGLWHRVVGPSATAAAAARRDAARPRGETPPPADAPPPARSDAPAADASPPRPRRIRPRSVAEGFDAPGEAPTTRLGRRRPDGPRPGPGPGPGPGLDEPDDPLTLRLDRPD